MSHFQDLSGRKFGHWTVVSVVPKSQGERSYSWLCRCVCGVEREVQGHALKIGRSTSCGCQATNKFKPTHGATNTPTFRVWSGMRQRCLDPNYHSYDRYGGSGIKIAERWMVYDNFLADMGERPAGLTLDRYPDHAGNYEPGNCRWATPKQQARNKRTTALVDGIAIADLAEKHGIPRATIQYRYRKGYRGADLIAPKLENGKKSKRFKAAQVTSR